MALNGKISKNNQSSSSVILSPHFPMYYPRDYGVQYIISCESENCRIRIIFVDYQISSASTFEFYDGAERGMRSIVYTGALFRPPIIYSRGSSLKIQFYANGGTGIGYKALIDFVSAENVSAPKNNPATDCGGFVQTLGGAITMMNMIEENSDENVLRNYDCFWVIKPPNTYLHLKTHLAIRVELFENMSNDSKLIIRQGITSDRDVLDVINANTTRSKMHVVPLSSGFYVSLRGSFGVHSKVAIVYTAFSYLGKKIFIIFLCYFSYLYMFILFMTQTATLDRNFCVRITNVFQFSCIVMDLIIVVMVAMNLQTVQRVRLIYF